MAWQAPSWKQTRDCTWMGNHQGESAENGNGKPSLLSLALETPCWECHNLTVTRWHLCLWSLKAHGSARSLEITRTGSSQCMYGRLFRNLLDVALSFVEQMHVLMKRNTIVSREISSPPNNCIDLHSVFRCIFVGTVIDALLLSLSVQRRLINTVNK